MHRHDQELIMALAEGNLAGDAAAAAQAEIAACAECSADLDLQIAAISMLEDVPKVYLTATESARLHAELKRELSLAAPSQAAPARRSFAWSRILPAAGVAAALLVVIVSLPSLLGGGSDSSDETVASPLFEAEATETTAARDVIGDGMEEMAGSDNAAAEAVPPALLETTAAPATTTTMADLADDSSADALPVLDFLGPIDEVDTAALLDLILSEDADLARNSELAKNLDPFFAGCLAESVTPEISSVYGLPADSEPLILGIVITERGEESILVAFVPASPAEPVFATVSPNCGSIELRP